MCLFLYLTCSDFLMLASFSFNFSFPILGLETKYQSLLFIALGNMLSQLSYSGSGWHTDITCFSPWFPSNTSDFNLDAARFYVHKNRIGLMSKDVQQKLTWLAWRPLQKSPKYFFLCPQQGQNTQAKRAKFAYFNASRHMLIHQLCPEYRRHYSSQTQWSKESLPCSHTQTFQHVPCYLQTYLAFLLEWREKKQLLTSTSY